MTTYPVTAFTQNFQKNTTGFCPPGSPNNPCDGKYNGGGTAQDYGEECTGPYALFGTGPAQGVENIFPTTGFTVTDDLYLSPTTAAPNGALIDDDVELNNNAGTYGIDNIITACPESGGFVINFGDGSPGQLRPATRAARVRPSPVSLASR